ncbi:amidase [Citricoccus sp. SGAir0253]|uniref:amidase n=1 Tax=Citricoccus sp. SGAir0253 TaxID=2567881 RepID=UPI0010CD6B7A|nr:amidase [Citricoccus sp. SGAir0253]QCU76833.1 amidase [Citricoccus sp. SGAir0253]
MDDPARTPALTRWSALRLRDALAAGELSATEATRHFLEVTERRNPQLGAFISVAPEAALARAAELDEHFARRGPVGALHGVPLAFKDLVDVAGMRTTFGSRVAVDAAPATEDDPLAATVHAAGAVSTGKTTVPEFGLPCHSENLISAPARNPLDPERTAGGSTGGGAAAVAAGMLPFAPGNDGGGSVRIPAAACGLVGLKPGRGAVPTDRQEDSVRNLSVSGPLARTAADAALLYDAMLGGPRGEGRSLARALRAEPDRLRIGVSTASPFSPDLEITLARPAVDALTAAAAALDRDGHEVAEAALRLAPGYHADFRAVWTAGLLEAPLPEGAEQRMGPLAAYFLELARRRPAEELAAAVQRLTAWAADARRQLAAHDVVLTPVLAFAPPRIGTFTALPPAQDYELQCRFTPYTSMVNVMGLPAVAVPVLVDDDGLSWSVQAIGRPGTEGPLLALAARMEHLLGRAGLVTGSPPR